MEWNMTTSSARQKPSTLPSNGGNTCPSYLMKSRQKSKREHDQLGKRHAFPLANDGGPLGLDNRTVGANNKTSPNIATSLTQKKAVKTVTANTHTGAENASEWAIQSWTASQLKRELKHFHQLQLDYEPHCCRFSKKKKKKGVLFAPTKNK